MANDEPQDQRHSDNSIHNLTPRQHVRLRPGMYIGGTDSDAPHHLINIVLDHMLEDIMMGQCDHIWLTLQPDQTVTVRDNGPGFPMKVHDDGTCLELCLESVPAGGDPCSRGGFDTQVGLHGMSLIVTNVLSSELSVKNWRDGHLWQKTYREGLPHTALSKQPLTEPKTGFQITFTPDFTILDPNEFDIEVVRHRCRELTYQLPDLTITLRDERTEPAHEETLHTPDGLKVQVADLNAGVTPIHDSVHVREEITLKDHKGEPLTLYVEFAYQFTEGDETHIHTYTNTVETTHGGVHQNALKDVLLGSVNDHIENCPSLLWATTPEPLTWAELSRGLSAVIAVRHPQPDFEGPTRTRMINRDVYGPVAGLVYESLHPADYQKRIIARIARHHVARRDSAQ